jgi:hypothetical protein
MDLQRARQIVGASALDDPGSFYGSPDGLALGTGLLIHGVEYPFFDPDRNRFSVRSGLIYVLSHECDLEPTNTRFLNGAGLICPILPVEAVLREAEGARVSEDDLAAFLGNVAARRVARCVYMPPLAEWLPDGGLLNLNLIASTTVDLLNAGQRVAAVSVFGLRAIDAALEQHLRREKAEPLPLSAATLRRPSSIRGDFPPSHSTGK